MHRAVVLALVAGIFSFAHAHLTEVVGITASANGWDTRVSGVGCAPNGCVPANILDDSIAPESRWSCQAASAGIEVCELTLEFDLPHDLVRMDMALYKGDKRIRSANVWVNGVFECTITSSGTTTDYETYELIAPGTTTVMLQAADTNDNGWLSITEVKFIEGHAAPTPSPITMPTWIAPPTILSPSSIPSPTTVDDDDFSLTPTISTPTTAALPPVLEFAGLPDIVFEAVLEDAPYGLANGVIRSDQYGIVLDPEDEGIAQFTGTVSLFDDEQASLAESITLYYYVYSDLDDPVTDFTRGVGEVDPSTGIFSATVSVPNGKSKVVLSFVVLDEADSTSNEYPDTVSVNDVLNDCGESYFTVTLEEWDNEEQYLYMIVREPNGYGGSPGSFQVNGVIISEPFGVYGTQTYRLYNGLPSDQDGVLGDYLVYVNREFQSQDDTNWNIIVRVNGEVVQEVSGLFAIGGESSPDSFTYTLDSYMSIADC